MTCKCLALKRVFMSPEIDASPYPKMADEAYCRLKREPHEHEPLWITRCEGTPHAGPCWVWERSHGQGAPDPRFERSCNTLTAR